MLLSEIPNLNLLYEDEKGIAVCHEWRGKYVIHSELYDENFSLENLKHAKEISDAIDKAFRAKDITTLYTWAETSEQERYNKFLGYKPTGQVVNATFVDKDYPYRVLEYKKELK